MLPGFRFLVAAVVLSVSVLIFGLGAAALLRSAHEQFASLPARPHPVETRFAQPVEAPSTLAMLRVDPPAQEIAVPPATVDPAVVAPPAEPEKITEPEQVAVPATALQAIEQPAPADPKISEPKLSEPRSSEAAIPEAPAAEPAPAAPPNDPTTAPEMAAIAPQTVTPPTAADVDSGLVTGTIAALEMPLASVPMPVARPVITPTRRTVRRRIVKRRRIAVRSPPAIARPAIAKPTDPFATGLR